MSMFFCDECGELADADEGCGEREDGIGLVCLNCVCENCGLRPIFHPAILTELNDQNLCASCLQDWIKGKRQYAP